jgi:hypothetical protein
MWSNKRNSSYYNIKKKRKLIEQYEKEQENDIELPNDILSTIEYVKAMNWNYKLFNRHWPCMIFLHQIYCIITDRTFVDRQIEELWKEKKIVRFKLGHSAEEYCILTMNDYQERIEEAKKKYQSSEINEKNGKSVFGRYIYVCVYNLLSELSCYIIN